MSISIRATGAYSEGTANLTPAIPVGAVSGDMMLCFYGTKPFDDAPTISTGWALIGSAVDGAVAAGNDLGSMQTRAYWKIHTGSESNPTITNATNNVSAAVIIVYQKGANDLWNTPVGSGGGDATAGTGFSVTCSSNPGITAGDVLVGYASIRSDAGTQSSITITATGLTMAAFTESPGTDLATLSGGDMAMSGGYSAVNAGNASAAPVYASTLAASHTGSAFVVRIRVRSNGEPAADNITLSDTASKQAGKVAADNVTLTDVATKNVGKAASDSVTFTDTSAKQINVVKTDSITLTDSPSKSPNIIKADSVTFSDLATFEKFINLNLNDSVIFSDESIRNVGVVKSDSISFTDTAIKDVSISKTDSITLSDVAVKTAGITKADNITLTDATVKSTSVNKADSLAFSEQISKESQLVKSDSVSLTDVAIKIVGSVQADALNLTDATIKQVGVQRTDDLSFTDAVAKQVGIVKEDGITLADSASGSTAQPVIEIDLSDDVGFSDAVSKVIHVALADGVLFTDLRVVSVTIQQQDQVVFVDLASREILPVDGITFTQLNRTHALDMTSNENAHDVAMIVSGIRHTITYTTNTP